MVWAAIIFVISIYSLEAWEFLDNNHLALINTWTIKSGISHQDRIKESFADETTVGCELMHQTDKVPSTAIVLYRDSGRLLCMGSIIDYRHIISAKRCYEKVDVTDLYVLVGYYKAYWGKKSQVKRVERIIRHDTDIALLRLGDKIRFTKFIRPTKLPSSFTKMERDIEKNWPSPYMVVGFLVDRFDVPGEYIPKDKIYNIKQDGLYDFGHCTTNFSKLNLDSHAQFCTIGNATYCWGGWGGAVLKWTLNSYYLQIGIVTADNCTTDKTGPLLVARTDVYGDWIRGNTWLSHQSSRSR